MRFVAMIVVCVMLCGCGLYRDSFKPESMAERKILASRKDQIIKNDKTDMIVIATHLNDVNPRVFDENREYFFIEIFSELEIPFISYMNFYLNDDSRFLWIREVDSDEYDNILNISNKWSKSFLLAFDALDGQKKKNMKLFLQVDTIGAMSFDFSYKVFKMQF